MQNFSFFKKLFYSALLSFIGFVSMGAQAYPSFIGYGYTSCIVCHFNPLGNGPLTDYGRALGATAIAAKPFYQADLDDETLGNQAGFLLGKVKLPDRLRAQINHRGMGLVSGIGTGSLYSNYILMQTDASLVAKTLDDRLVAVINAGIYPPPAGGGNPGFVSREHYVSYAILPKLRVMAGLMDVAFGIRTADHVASSRTMTKIGQNDQVHGVLLHLGIKGSEFAIHGFAGNLYQTPQSVVPKGASMMFETEVAKQVRVGASGLYSASTIRERKLFALHTRAGLAKGSSVLFETGLVSDNRKNVSPELGNYIYFQSMARMIRGLHWLMTVDYSSQDAFKPHPRRFTVGPSLQRFPTGFAELRLDVWGTRVLDSSALVNQPDSFKILGQLHLWF